MIAFLFTPLGRYIMIGGLIIVALGGVYEDQGRRRSRDSGGGDR